MLPVQILKDHAQEERGDSARLSSFVGAIAIGDLVKTTLGPKGMVSYHENNFEFKFFLFALNRIFFW